MSAGIQKHKENEFRELQDMGQRLRDENKDQGREMDINTNMQGILKHQCPVLEKSWNPESFGKVMH